MAEWVVVTAEHFSDKHWKAPRHFQFAARSHIVPVTAAELSHVVASYPLAFVQTEESWQLVAVLSLQPQDNQFVGPGGQWLGGYIPAALRSHPFRLAKAGQSSESVLAVLDDAEWVVPKGQGQPFFEENSPQPSEPIKGILNFLSQLGNNRVVTQKAVDALAAAGVIVPWEFKAEVMGEVKSVVGLYRIDEARLNALEHEAFGGLRSTGALALAYAQLFAQVQLGNLKKAAQAKARLVAVAAEGEAAQPWEGLGLSGGDTLKFS